MTSSVYQPLNISTPTAQYGAVPGEDDIEGGEGVDKAGDREEEELNRSRSFSLPLLNLPESEMVDEVTVIASTINALLGVSLFSMPWGFEESGILGGVLVLSIVGFLSFDTSRMLILAQKFYFINGGEVKGYPEIAGASLGNKWAYVVKTATIISCLGGCTGYLIFFGETVGQALSVNPETVIYISTIPLIFLSWIRSFHDLTIFTVFGVIALTIAVIAILAEGSKNYDHDINTVPLFETKSWYNFLGPATFLFTIHYFILALGEEALRMKTFVPTTPLIPHRNGNNNNNNNNEVEVEASTSSALIYPISLSYLISIVFIIVLGGLGYIMYRSVELVRNPAGKVLSGCEDHVCQNIILNLSPGLVRDIVGLTMSLCIILSYILILAPAREHVENMVLNWSKPSTARIEIWTVNALRTCLVLLTVSIALNSPGSASMLGAVGGLTDALQCFVLPPMIYLKLYSHKISWNFQIYYSIIILWGIGIMFYTTFFSMPTIIKEMMQESND